MNSKNMKISIHDGIMTILYNCGVIQKVMLKNYSGIIRFYLHNGDMFFCDISTHLLPDIVYLSSFGISITEDGKYFFVQSWEKGLFCFALPSGTLMWRSERKKANKLVTRNEAIICRFVDQCIERINIPSGEVTAHYPLGWATNFYPLDDCNYLVGPKRGKYYILDDHLQPKEMILYQKLNPALLDTCMIIDAEHITGGMTISGFEYMDDYYHEQKLMGNTDMEQYRFSRFVPLDCFRSELVHNPEH